MASGEKFTAEFDILVGGLDKIEDVLDKIKKLFSIFNSDLMSSSTLLKQFEDAFKTVGSTKATASKIGKMYEEKLKDYTDLIDKLTKTANIQENLNERQNKSIKHESEQTERKSEIDKEYINLSMDRLAALKKLSSEAVKEHILLRSSNTLKIEEMKTSREKMRTLKKMIGGAQGGTGGTFSGMLGMGVSMGGLGMAGLGESIGDKMKGASSRLLEYKEKQRTGHNNAMSGGGQQNIFKTLEKLSPTLSKAMLGGKEGGGILSKGAGVMDKMGGMGAMIGGGAAGIVGGLIMKGLESSPTFQAISKVLNQAFSFYLRPIGDFVGGFFKPIATVMIKSAALSMRKAIGVINYGETLGKAVIALLSNPLGFIESAFVSLIRMIDEWWYSVNPINVGKDKNAYKSTFADDKKSLFDEGNKTGFITDQYSKVISALDAELAKISVPLDDIRKHISSVSGEIKITVSPFTDSMNKASTAVEKFTDSLQKSSEKVVVKDTRQFQGDQGQAKDYLGRTPQEVSALSKTRVITGQRDLAAEQKALEEKNSIKPNTSSQAKKAIKIVNGVPIYADSGSTKKLADGGMINEFIMGIGESGQKYTFGEKGAEMVTPANKINNGGSTTININISNMSGDRGDVEKLRKTILGIMQDVNSNRGR